MSTPSQQSTREVALVSSVRPSITRLIDALERGDLAAAKAAYADYDAGWNGIEVYVSVRSKPMYNDLEADLQAQINAGLNAENPELASLVPVAKKLLAKYDEAIAMVTAGPSLSPLFDDVAAIRIVRADLRRVNGALKQGEVDSARSSFHAFEKGWPRAQSLMSERAPEAVEKTNSALTALGRSFSQSGASPESLRPEVEALLEQYNEGLSPVNLAARATMA
jgi:hypothetical protein